LFSLQLLLQIFFTALRLLHNTLRFPVRHLSTAKQPLLTQRFFTSN